ncbi:MAG: hypothetical protein JXQ96_00545 [Cyclobacteriaceae bacterium]
MDRKSFITTGIGAGLGLSLTPYLVLSKGLQEPAQLEKPLVKEFVVAGHKDLDKVKSMLNDYPNLLYCRYDWGNGDFEEAIEGAGHLGNKEIANYLIEQGARVNIFVLTMLGKVKIVKSMLQEYPNLVNAKGPHGFTLLHHAKVGGEESRELFDYFQEKGLTETNIPLR